MPWQPVSRVRNTLLAGVFLMLEGDFMFALNVPWVNGWSPVSQASWCCSVLSELFPFWPYDRTGVISRAHEKGRTKGPARYEG
jgi:hypothetical protein